MRFPFATSPMIVAILWALAGCFIVLFIARRALGKHEKTVPLRVMIGLPIAAILAVVIAFSIIVVDVGTVEVVVSYGSVQKRRYDPGIHFIVPGSRHDHVWVRRQIIEISSLDPEAAATAGTSPTPEAQRTLALTSDRIALAADITLPYEINPDLAWKVFADINPAYEALLLIPAARAAVRDAVASFTWTDALTTKRSELEAKILAVYRGLVEDNLLAAGFSKDEASHTFILMPPQIRRLAPPHVLLSAVADRVSAEVNLERQGVLNKIAESEATRRANEGMGVRKMLDELPKSYTAEQMTQLIMAMADKVRADALQRAVEKDQVKIIVMSGGANAPITVPAP
jgi:regulator of protease activity HflC (stomatin/prohibitin superfamily)